MGTDDSSKQIIIGVMLKTHFVDIIMNNVANILRSEKLTDECLRVIVPLTRPIDKFAIDSEEQLDSHLSSKDANANSNAALHKRILHHMSSWYVHVCLESSGS